MVSREIYVYRSLENFRISQDHKKYIDNFLLDFILRTPSEVLKRICYYNIFLK